MTTSDRCPQFLVHVDVGHAPLFVITFLVGVYLDYSLVAHLCCREGYFLVDALRASQST